MTSRHSEAAAAAAAEEEEDQEVIFLLLWKYKEIFLICQAELYIGILLFSLFLLAWQH
jgi:hypothetical protein